MRARFSRGWRDPLFFVCSSIGLEVDTYCFLLSPSPCKMPLFRSAGLGTTDGPVEVEVGGSAAVTPDNFRLLDWPGVRLGEDGPPIFYTGAGRMAGGRWSRRRWRLGGGPAVHGDAPGAGCPMLFYGQGPGEHEDRLEYHRRALGGRPYVLRSGRLRPPERSGHGVERGRHHEVADPKANLTRRRRDRKGDDPGGKGCRADRMTHSRGGRCSGGGGSRSAGIRSPTAEAMGHPTKRTVGR
jgi:hypothetical protein